MCQNGTLAGHLGGIATPPFPHPSPSIDPPYPIRNLKCAILAQFVVPKTPESRSGLRGTGGSHLEAI